MRHTLLVHAMRRHQIKMSADNGCDSCPCYQSMLLTDNLVYRRIWAKCGVSKSGAMKKAKELPESVPCPICGRRPLTIRFRNELESGYRTACGIDDGDNTHEISSHHAATKAESIEKWNRIAVKTMLLMKATE